MKPGLQGATSTCDVKPKIIHIRSWRTLRFTTMVARKIHLYFSMVHCLPWDNAQVGDTMRFRSRVGSNFYPEYQIKETFNLTLFGREILGGAGRRRVCNKGV